MGQPATASREFGPAARGDLVAVGHSLDLTGDPTGSEAMKMDTGTPGKDIPFPGTDGEDTWAGELLASCRMLRSAPDKAITAVSVTLPRADDPDNLVEVELVSIGLESQQPPQDKTLMKC